MLVNDTIINKFDDILGRNMERLIGSRYGIGGLLTGINALSCIILLNEQVRNDVAEDPVALEDYTAETLFNELEEMGLDSGEGMEATVHDMVSKGYIEFDEEDRILVKKPTVTMAQVLDHVYPSMPGLNLIAYLSQTLDEVRSGRKDQHAATDQLDQVLRMQGVPLKKRQSQPINGGSTRLDNLRRKVAQASLWVNTERPDPGGRIIKASDVRVSGNSASSRAESVAPPEASGTVKSDGEPQDVEVDRGVHTDDPPVVPFHDMESGEALVRVAPGHENVDEEELGVYQSENAVDPTYTTESNQTQGFDNTVNEEIDAEDDDEDVLQETMPSFHTVVPECRDGENDALSLMAEETEAVGIVEEPVASSEKSLSLDAELSIDSRIAAFEAGLAMKCPLCNIGTVQARETSTGRQYYVCTHKDCSFISWGKPYHSACPDCGNTFLVETVLKGGIPVLKCPRATCLYWKKHTSELMRDVPSHDAETSPEVRPGLVAVAARPRKKVVRRRVVRKKSS